MALNKDFKDYSYNLGRAVAVVEIINGLRQTFASDVANNAKDKLPYQLTEALKNEDDTAVVITLSGKLSGTYQSACMAAEEWGRETPNC